MKKKDQLKLNVLLEEYKIVNIRIENFLSAQKKLFILGVGIIFSLLGLFHETKEVLIALPFFLISYLGLILYHYQRTITSQIYKGELEQSINSIVGENTLYFYKLGFDKIEKNNLFVVANFLSYFLIFVFSIIIFLSYYLPKIKDTSILITSIMLGILILLFAVASISIFRNKRVVKQGIIDIKRKQDPNIKCSSCC